MNIHDHEDRAEFIYAFGIAASWQAYDDDHGGLEGFDFSPEAEEKIEAWCNEFMDAHCVELAGVITAREAGTCFALSANGHGAGFMYHLYNEHALKLCDDSKPYAYHVWLTDKPEYLLEIE